MINDETKRKLRELNMQELVNGLETQQAEPAVVSLTFDERIQRVVDYVYQEKYNSKIQRLIRSAKLRFHRQIYIPFTMMAGISIKICWPNCSRVST